MKRLISILITVTMLCPILPVTSYAENEVADTSQEVVTEATEETDDTNIGKVASVGDEVYYIENGDLYRSVDNDAELVDENVTWVIARNEIFYWSKLEENNTSSIVSTDTVTYDDGVVTKLFMPVEAFDVSGDELYYLYNGEILKINIETKVEENIKNDKNIRGFYVNQTGNIQIVESYNVSHNFLKNGVTLQGITSYSEYRKKVNKINNANPASQAQIYRYNDSGLCNVATMTMLLNRKAKQLNKNNVQFDVFDVFNGCGATSASYAGQYKSYDSYTYSGGTGSWASKTYVDKGGNLTCNATVVSYGGVNDDYLTSLLREHPEGIAVRTFYGGNGYGHCIVITDYEETYNGIQYYAVDPVNVKWGSGRVRIEDTWMHSVQNNILSNINFISVIGGSKVNKTSSGSNTSYGGSTKTSTTNAKKANSIVNPSITIDLTSKPSSIYVGQSYPIRGTITSNYPIYYISGSIVDSNGNTVIPWININPGGSKKITIGQSHPLNTNMTFDSIKKAGNYKIRIIVNCNSDGSQTNVKTFDFDFTVRQEEQSNAPSIKSSTIEDGQKVTISCSDSSATIHYSINGGKEQTGKGSITKEFKTVGTYNISAYTTKSGYNNSTTVKKTVSVSKVKNPTISSIKYGDKNAWVTISGSGTINYTTNGSNPTKSSTKYNGTIYLKDSATIKAFARQYGKQSSDIVSKSFTVKAPDAPQISITTANKIAQGRTASVKWSKVDRATSYTAYLYYNNEQVDTYKTSGTSASFKLPEVGNYSIRVVASNFKGNSSASNSVSVESMAPVTVTIVDRVVRNSSVTDDVVETVQNNINEHDGDNAEKLEGNVISVQKVDYGDKPSIPLWKDKKGLSRQYFSSELYEPATEDKTAYAYYSINSYNVEFFDTSTDVPSSLGVQKVLYTYSADEPTDYNTPVGYALNGWSIDNSKSTGFDYKYVDGNIRLSTAYSWEHKDLPIVLEIKNIVRADKSYEVNVKVKNNPVTDTQGRLVLALYTADGKNVYNQIADMDIDLGTQNDWTDLKTITLLYDGKVTSASAFVVAVDGDKTGGALSAAAVYDKITYSDKSQYWSDWSDWSTTAVTADDYTKVETKTQYRYRDKSTTTSTTTKSLSGWTYSSTKSTTGSWSSYSKTSVKAVNTDALKREVQTKTVPATYKTQYRYGRYRLPGYNICACKKCGEAIDSRGTWEYQTSKWVDEKVKPMSVYAYWPSVSSHNHKDIAYSSNGTDYWYKYEINGAYWFYLDSTRSVVDVAAYTAYRYRDTTYVHSFYKWSNWADWADKSYTASSNREVQNRTMYRYKTSGGVDSEKEEETVYRYRKSGALDNISEDLSGKLATVMIYKKTNTDPTQAQIEYINQIEIGAGNTYEIDANTKEMIDYEKTGDFIVALSIEGSESLVNVDYIKAEVPTHTVSFYAQGELIKSVEVADGSGIDLNEIQLGIGDVPVPEGYKFVGWDSSLVNITEPTDINAVFEREKYTVVFVDYENETAQMADVYYGDSVVLPEVEPIEGYIFKGWDIDNYKYAEMKDINRDVYDVVEGPFYKIDDETYVSVDSYDPEEYGNIDRTEYYKASSSEDNIITGSKIVSAIWEPEVYEVTFCDFDGDPIDSELAVQKVSYGESAILPDLFEHDGVLYSWDITGEEWWNVTRDMAVKPYIPQTVEVNAPTISAPTTNSYGAFMAELETDNENNTIYYSLDYSITENDAKRYIEETIHGSNLNDVSIQSISLMNTDDMNDENEETIYDYSDDETQASKVITQYFEPIELYAGCFIHAFAVDNDGNISPISVFQYEYNYDDENLGIVSNEYVPDADTPQITISTIDSQAGKTVTLPVSIKNNMGITDLEMNLEYNPEILELNGIANGNVFSNKQFTYSEDEDGYINVKWKTDADNAKDGTLLNLTFTVLSTQNKSKQLIDLNVDYSADENDEEWYFVTVPGALLFSANNESDEITVNKVNDENGTYYDISSKTGETLQPLMLYTAIYNSDKTLKTVSADKYEADGDGIITVPIAEPQLGENETCKIMLWTLEQKPIIEAISSMTN